MTKRHLLFGLFTLCNFAYFYSLPNQRDLPDTNNHSQTSRAPSSTSASDEAILQAFRNHTPTLQVTGTATIKKILPDDTKQIRHQKFLISLKNGHTLLVAHNIDQARRVPNLQIGDLIEFSGEYKWTEQGGVIHWTHRSDRSSHPSGWLKYQGDTYQ